MSSTRMRPFEARMAALRAAKSPGCGCGHAHGAAHPVHEPRISLAEPIAGSSVVSAPSTAPSSALAKEAV